MIQLSSFIWYLVTLAFSLTGQALLKKGVMLKLAGATPSMSEFLRHHLLGLAFSPHVVGGVLMSGLGVIAWVYVLSRFELSRALPILGGLGYICMFLIGRLVLREPTSWINFGGILCVVAGLYLLSVKGA